MKKDWLKVCEEAVDILQVLNYCSQADATASITRASSLLLSSIVLKVIELFLLSRYFPYHDDSVNFMK